VAKPVQPRLHGLPRLQTERHLRLSIDSGPELAIGMTSITMQQGKPQMLKYVRAFLREEEGLTMVEYAIAGALVAAATVTAFTSLGSSVIDRINTLAADVAA